MLRNIHLHGRLGKKFGRKHRLSVNSAAEAIRALCVLIPGFEKHARESQYALVVGDDRPVDIDTLDLGFGGAKDFHIVPAGAVAGIETIILVGALVVTAALTAVTLLSMPKAPNPNDRERDTKDSSFIFDGATNVTEQGHPVPLVYGKMLVGSVVVSAGISTSDLNQADVGGRSGAAGYTSGFGAVGGGGGSEWEHLQLLKGGKSGGGSTRSAQEAPNSLQSQATARIVDLIAEGEIGGLVDGLRSVFLDGTPIQNSDDSYNFAGVAVEERVGLPDQDPMPGYSQQESTTTVSTDVTQLTGPVTRTIQGQDTDVARVTIRLPSLYKQNTENGDIQNHSVIVAIELQQDGGGFTEVVRHTFSGKTNSAYQRSFDIRLPSGDGPFDIRVKRISPDSQLSSIQDETIWDLLTEIIEAKLIYPDTALIGLTVDASQFGTNIAERSYLIYGRLVEIPTNYDPITRVYTGIWDGTFKRAWTDCGPWIFRDIVINNRFGLGDRVPETSVDKWALYAAAEYSDEDVPDGFGGTQPRYRLNCSITKRTQAYDVLASVASNFRGWVYWGSGSIRLAQDRPEDPSVLVNQTNVVEGKIEYDRVTPLEKRRSVAIVWWNDPDDNYRLTPAIVEDPDLVRRFGWEPREELTAFGVTDAGHAVRFAKLLLEDESQASNASAAYSVGSDHSLVEPGRVTEIADPRYASTRRGGRVKQVLANQITLDSPVNFEAGQTYTIAVIMPDSSVARRPVTNSAGETDVVSLGGGAWSPLPIAGAVWNIESDAVVNRRFRVRSIGADDAPYPVRAIAHDPTKYARVEQGLDLTSPTYFETPTGGLARPGDMSHIELLVRDGNSAQPGVLVSWQASADPRVLFYQSQFRRPNGQWEPLGDSSELNQQIVGVSPGVWGFRVRSLDSLGRKTEWVVYEATLAGQVDALPDPVSPTTDVDDEALTPMLVWDGPADTRPLRYEILFSATDDVSTASSVGFTETREFPITRQGFYWIQSEFAGEVGSPVRVAVGSADLPSPQYARIDGAPNSLNDLDPASWGVLDSLGDDVDDLEATYGSTASAAASAQAAQDARGDALAAEATAMAQAVAAAASAGQATNSASAASSSAATASSSATSAASDSLLAATYVSEANAAATQSFPSTFESDGEFFGGDNGGLTPANIAFVSGSSGRVARVANPVDYGLISVLQHRPAETGDKIKVRALVAHVSGTPNTVQLRVEGHTKARHDGLTGRNSLNGHTSAVITSTTPIWVEHVFTVTGGGPFYSAAIVMNFPSAYTAVQDVLALEYENVTAQEASAASASVASSQAAVATAEAAYAAESRTLSAGFASGAINPNANFSLGTIGSVVGTGATAVTQTTGWVNWKGTSTHKTYVAGDGMNPVAVNCVADAGLNGGFFLVDNIANLFPMQPNSKYVVEADVELLAGTWRGAGVYWAGRYNFPSPISSGTNRMSFTANDSNGVPQGDGAVGDRRTYSMLVQTGTYTEYGLVYAINHWNGFTIGANGTPVNGADISTSNTIKWHGLRIRKATQAEIEQDEVLGPLEATVTTQAVAIASLDGRTESHLINTAGVGQTEAVLGLSAVDSNGNAASSITLMADAIGLGGLSGKVLDISNGAARFNGMLHAAAGIQIGPSDDPWLVGLQPKTFSVSDGDAISYGVDIGSLPKLQFSTYGLDPLATDEVYKLYADSQTTSGCTVRLKIEEPAGSTDYLLTTDAAHSTGPPRQVDKGANPDATSGSYRIKCIGTVTVQNQYFNTGSGGGGSGNIPSSS